MKIFYTVVLLTTCPACALFEYDRAVDVAQKNRWQDAISMFKQLVAEKPDNTELLYDTGVAAFNNEDYQQAKAYFESAAQHADSSKQLKAQAYFNKGNAHVQLQELKEALLSYEQALMVQPEDERAKHNHQAVKKMLEQQEQQQKKQQQQDNQQNRPDQQQEKQDEQQSCNNNNRSSQDNNDSKESGSDEQKDQSDQESSKHDGLDKDSNKQDEQQNGPDEKKDQSDQDDNGNEGDIPDQGPQEHEQDKQKEQDGHNTNPQEQDSQQQEVPQQHMQSSQKEQEDQSGQQPVEPLLDQRLQQVLEKRGKRDEQLNKQVIKASVQQMKGEHGQNCW